MSHISIKKSLMMVSAFIALTALALVMLPIFNKAAYADEFISTPEKPLNSYECSKGNDHYNGFFVGVIPYFYDFREGVSYSPTETILHIYDKTAVKYINHTVEPSDIVSIQKNTLNGEIVFRTTPNKTGIARLTIDFEFSDGCTLAYSRDIHVIGCPFNIKGAYTLKVGGEPVVIKYVGTKEGKLELTSFGVHSPATGPLLKTTLSDNDSTLIIEAVRTPLQNEVGSLGITTYEREIGDDTWPTYGDYHNIEIAVDNGSQKQPDTSADKQSKTLNPQTLRAYTSLLHPLYIETQSIASLGTANVASSNPSVADASYANGVLRINGKKAGTATLTIKADKALYDYTMKVTVNAVPIKAENIKTNNTGIKFATMLGGKNVPEGAEAVIEAKKINSGSPYTALQQAAKNNVIGVYSVNLGVDGKDIHDDFGTIDLTFPVPSDYTSSSVRISHLHETAGEQFKAGEITTEIVPVVNGEATITVRDLSTFALESSTTSVTSNTGAGISGNTSTAANPGTSGSNKNATTQAGQSTNGGTGANLVKTGDSALGFALLSLSLVSLLLCGGLFLALKRK